MTTRFDPARPWTRPDRRGRRAGNVLPALAGVLALGLALAGGAAAAQEDAAAGAGTAAAGEPLILEYEAYFGGFHIGSARAEIRAGERTYRVVGKGRARGLLDWYSGWRGEVMTRGTFPAAETPRPDRHEHSGQWRESRRWRTLTYAADGTIHKEEGSPPDESELTPIPPGSTRNTIDAVTAVLTMARRLAAGEPCAAELSIYDGRRRYDLTVTDGGTRRFEANDYTVFSGEARACHLAIEQIGGFRKDQSKYSRTARKRVVWVAPPFEGALPVPVRVEVATAYGTAVMHLVGAHKGARRIALEPGRDVMAD